MTSQYNFESIKQSAVISEGEDQEWDESFRSSSGLNLISKSVDLSTSLKIANTWHLTNEVLWAYALIPRMPPAGPFTSLFTALQSPGLAIFPDAIGY